jgi:metal-sulfur cluster biosynthetic enzyme
MIQNKNLCKAAKRKCITVNHDISDTRQYCTTYLDPENPTKITDIYMYYSVATNTGTLTEKINVGTPATAALYCAVTPVISQAVGTLAKQTLASAALLPAGTALVVRRSAVVGGTNTGEVIVTVFFETVDRGVQRA